MHPHVYQCRISTMMIFVLECLKPDVRIVRKMWVSIWSLIIGQIEKSITTGRSEQESLSASVYFLRSRVFWSEQRWELSLNMLGRGREGLKLRISWRNPKICCLYPALTENDNCVIEERTLKKIIIVEQREENYFHHLSIKCYNILSIKHCFLMQPSSLSLILFLSWGRVMISCIWTTVNFWFCGLVSFFKQMYKSFPCRCSAFWL